MGLEFIRELKQGFESSSGLTPEFDGFSRMFAKEMKAFLSKEFGAYDIQLRRGHFYIYGFFTIPAHHVPEREGWSESEAPAQVWYISTGDVRFGMPKTYGILLRTAHDYKDFTGGQNRAARIDNERDFIADMKRILRGD